MSSPLQTKCYSFQTFKLDRNNIILYMSFCNFLFHYILCSWDLTIMMIDSDHLTAIYIEKCLLPPEKSVCRTRNNSLYWTWNNRLVPNWERSTSRLYVVTLLYNLYAEYIIRNAGLDEAQAGIKIAGRNINNLRHADDTTLWQKLKN